MISLVNIVKYFNNLPQQLEALQKLDETLLSKYPEIISEDAEWVKVWRTPNSIPVSQEFGRKINKEGLDLIKDFEGLVLDAYLCPADVWTIGYGHTGDVKPGMRISQNEAENLLRQDLNYFEGEVQKLVEVPLNENQFAALVSFAFNVGVGALADSTLLRLLNSGAYGGAANQFMAWVHGGGVELPGLVRRREAERSLFLA